jgi:hypothetical protein
VPFSLGIQIPKINAADFFSFFCQATKEKKQKKVALYLIIPATFFREFTEKESSKETSCYAQSYFNNQCN